MKRIILVCFALLPLTGVWSQPPQTPIRDHAIVTGEYEKEYVPDEIYIGITIRERDSKGKISIEEQQQAMLEALKEQGIDIQKSLRVKGISSSFYKKGQNMAFGRYELKLATPAELYTVYAVLDNLDISEVKLQSIDRSDCEQLRLEVIAEAMKNARRKAEAIAATEGLKVGKCIYFKDDITTLREPHPSEYLEGMVAGVGIYGARSSQPIKVFTSPEIGEVKISGSVEANFLLE